jgi:hypothetical protein
MFIKVTALMVRIGLDRQMAPVTYSVQELSIKMNL